MSARLPDGVLRTPDACFSGLPDFPFAPHYQFVPDARFGALRMHYLDEGPRDGPVVLLTHGQGCWSYLYRHMLPLLSAAGCRVIAPDYIGFGRSDKLAREADYSFQAHIDWLTAFLDARQLSEVTGFLFDWGGFFGLRIAAERPEIFGRLALLNTNLPTGNAAGREWFVNWRAEMLARPRFPQGEMVNDGVVRKLAPEIIAAYDAAYPDERYKTGPRRFPMILPIDADDPAAPANRAAWERLAHWEKPALTLFSAAFAGSAMGPERLLAHLPGCRGQAHALLPETNFYLVEDAGPELARRTLAFMGLGSGT